MEKSSRRDICNFSSNFYLLTPTGTNLQEASRPVWPESAQTYSLGDSEDQKSCKGALGRAAYFLESLEEALFSYFCSFYGCLRSLAYSLHLPPSSVEQQSRPASSAASLHLVLCLFATQTLAIPSTDLDNPD